MVQLPFMKVFYPNLNLTGEINMIARFHKLVGNRLPLKIAVNDSVEIFAWYHPIYAPAHHVALRITKGQEIYYLSISPTIHPNFSGCSLFDLRKGIDANFLSSYEDELLVQGLRNTWPAIKDTFNEEQKKLIPAETSIPSETMKKITDREALEIARLFPVEMQDKLRLKGTPVQTIQLRSLDLDPMIARIKLLTAPENKTKYALWSDTKLQEKCTYNCASAIYSVLAEGGFGNLIESSNYLFGIAGALIGASYAYNYATSWRDAVKDITIATLAGRGIGGAYDGYTGIQSYLNFNVAKGKDSQSAAIAFRILSTTLSGFIGAIMPGPVIPSVIAMPADIMKLASEAKSEEDDRHLPAGYRPREHKH
jgi:hypothetical protein